MSGTCATMFSGGGGADLGLMVAGYTPAWAVEIDPAIAEVYRANIGPHVLVRDVGAVDFSRLDRPDILWCSPECKEFSQAKSSRAESGIQHAQADAICEALRILTPEGFILENVYGYRLSRSFLRICATLDQLGYIWDYENVNAADCGVPQTRRRLILRASRLGLLRALPPPVPWVGWYAAIEDLIPTLPESQFAPWQLARLPDDLREVLLVCSMRGENSQSIVQPLRKEGEPSQTIGASASPGGWRAFLHMTANTNLSQPTGTGILPVPSPANTVTAASGSARAFLVDGMTNLHGSSVTIRDRDDPAMAIRMSDHKQGRRAWLSEGRVVAMTPRALARFQSFPDSYALPESRSLASRIIGNAVPPLLAQVVAETLLAEELEVPA